MFKPEMIVVHHSATTDDGHLSWGAIRNYHINVNKWVDIGYHLGFEMVRDAANVLRPETMLGRNPNVVGAHVAGYNHKSLGVCFVGNYDVQDLPEELLVVGASRLSWLMFEFNIKPDSIVPHRAFSNKTCPGKKFPMSELVAMATKKLSALVMED